MFQGSAFLVVVSDAFTDEEVNDVESMLKQNNAKVFVKEEHDNEVNYLGTEAVSNTPIDHIICKSVEFIEYNLAQTSMVPITTPEWVFDSVSRAKISNPKVYSPDPKLFLKDTFVCVADNLPVGDKEAIYGGVRAFGGQYLDDLTRYTTHLIAMDMNNDKSVIATSAINTTQENGDKIDIKIVLPHWIDDCLKMGKKLHEEPYMLPSPSILKTTLEGIDSPVITEDDVLPIDSSKSSFLDNKLFYISPDYKISHRLTSAIGALIKKHGGKVTTQFDSKMVDIYIGQYRAGDAYITSCKSNRIIVGNLQWLYSIIVSNKWKLPINSNLLHYPIPLTSLPDFQNLKISVTNYSGDARFYLSKLITILGGTFTKTLTRDNDFLVAAKPEGKKYEAAKVKWRSEDNNNIKIVNHLWLEECFANWKLMEYDRPQYQFLGNNANGVEKLLCKTKLKQNVLESWYNQENIASEKENVADSMSEDESTQPKSRLKSNTKTSNTKKSPLTNGSVTDENIEQEEEIQDEQKDDDEQEKIKAKEDETRLSTKEKTKKSSLPSEICKEDDEAVLPATPITGRSGRSAKQKAVNKLHSDMNDLNDYQQMSKSSRKMKSYMEELEKSSSAKRKAEIENKDTNTIETPVKAKKRKTESPRPDTDTKIVAVITGCENEITLTRQDTQNLNHIGVKVLSDYSTKQGINTLIAPRILRTAKFLRSLSQVDKIIHPNYLIDVLKKLNSSQDADGDQVSKEFSINDYSLDKVIPIKAINQELGVTNAKENGLANLLNTTNRGLIFQDLKINLSSNLVGGVQVISEILESHGLAEAKSIKSVTAANTKSLLTNDDGKTIMIAHKSKDAKLITSFKKNVQNGVIVEWDWCVKSIFKMKLEEFDSYQLL